MAKYHHELLTASRRLLARRTGQRGKLPSARIRRSISTSYYALFHFLIEEAANRLVGSHNDFRRRRRIFIRNFTHAGIKVALDRVKGRTVDAVAEDFLRPRGGAAGPVAVPRFAQNLARAFSDAHTKRHDADYDLNKQLSEEDARALRLRIARVTDAWQAANSAADRDFKHALCLLMTLKGQRRQQS
jgi:uncharacterized protein (UPF0332 family)